jgi:cation diffusion facilitator CzcD-associated flavoprotein CzcO
MSTRPLHRDFSIGIVGAGFGGLAAAIEFKRNGFNSFTVFERQHDVGGVWRANTYPGAACDLPSDIYTFSFAFKLIGCGATALSPRSSSTWPASLTNTA